jgi:hypothetical protein
MDLTLMSKVAALKWYESQLNNVVAEIPASKDGSDRQNDLIKRKRYYQERIDVLRDDVAEMAEREYQDSRSAKERCVKELCVEEYFGMSSEKIKSGSYAFKGKNPLSISGSELYDHCVNLLELFEQKYIYKNGM